MKISKLLMGLTLVLALGFASCKPNDADVKKNVETALTTNPDAGSVVVSVDKGVATLSGEVKDEATRASVEAAAKGAKGVSNVVNNTTVPAPQVVEVPVIAPTEVLSAGVKDATKDFPTVTATVDADGVVTLNGTLAKSKLVNLMQALNTLKPKKIENKLTIK